MFYQYRKYPKHLLTLVSQKLTLGLIRPKKIGVQVQMSKKEILEYSVKCVVEGLGMRVWKEEATRKIRWEDEGGVGK